jgi:hypothetical protein
MIEYIILIIAAILAVLFIVRTIIKLAKGESPCMFCKSCGDKDQASCCTPETADKKEQEETKKD